MVGKLAGRHLVDVSAPTRSQGTQRVPSHQRCQVRPSRPGAKTSSRSGPHDEAAGGPRQLAAERLPRMPRRRRPSSDPTARRRGRPRRPPSGRPPRPSPRSRRRPSRRATPASAQPSPVEGAMPDRARRTSTQKRSSRPGPHETAAVRASVPPAVSAIASSFGFTSVHEPRHRLLVVRRREAGDEVVVADRGVRGEHLDDVLRRPDRLVRPRGPPCRCARRSPSGRASPRPASRG